MNAHSPHKLRIAVWHNLPTGGGKRALYCHVRGLVERGHTVEAWCPPTADQAHLPLSALIPEHIVPLHWDDGRPRNPAARVRQVGNMIRAPPGKTPTVSSPRWRVDEHSPHICLGRQQDRDHNIRQHTERTTCRHVDGCRAGTADAYACAQPTA